MSPSRSAIALTTLLLAAVAPAHAAAAIFDVNSTVDAGDAAIDGTCASAAGACTLRAAVQEANATLAVADTINVPAGKYTLKLTGPFEEQAATGDLDIRADLTIVGAGAASTIIIAKKDRVFDVFDDSDVAISGLTITKGKLGKGKETGIDLQGAGIFNDGNLTLTDVVVSSNKTTDDAGAIHNEDSLIGERVTIIKNKCRFDGGGINHVGTELTLRNSTIAKNKAGHEGGGIQNIGSPMTLVNVTISGNAAVGPGGGVNLEGSDPITDIRSATFFGNKSKELGGGIANQSINSVPFVTNTVLAKNKPDNCNDFVGSGGGNLETLAGCGFPAPVSTIKKIGMKGLKQNGGATATHALTDASPAIDAAVDAQCLPTDQRGTARVDLVGVGTSLCDSGAFEFVPGL